MLIILLYSIRIHKQQIVRQIEFQSLSKVDVTWRYGDLNITIIHEIADFPNNFTYPISNPSRVSRNEFGR